jgi:hypothetical protein
LRDELRDERRDESRVDDLPDLPLSLARPEPREERRDCPPFGLRELIRLEFRLAWAGNAPPDVVSSVVPE